MNFVIVLLSALLMLDCTLLILLVLIQLPKKEAGIGLAFGAGATDALFGAGSGNALTKLTKYAAGTFLVCVILLSVLAQATYKRSTAGFEQQLKQDANKMSTPTLSAPTTNSSSFKPLSTTTTNAAMAAGSNVLKSVTTNALANPK